MRSVKALVVKGPSSTARWARIAVVTLLVLNVVAAGFVLYPPGGSAESLARQLASLQSQIGQKRAVLATARQHTASIEKGRADGDSFLNEYFLARRTAYAAVVSELSEAARDARIKEREITFSPEPIEGSDALSMMTITANYEGAYRDLVSFIRQIDQSPRLLIIESLTAAPQAGSNTLSVSMKIDAFIREEGDLAPGAVPGSAPAQTPPAQVPAAGPVAALTQPGGRAMKFLPNTLGAEPKKIAILGGLVVLLGGVYWMNQPDSGPPPSATSTTAAPPVIPKVPAVPQRTSSNTPGPRRTAANAGARVIQDFRPSLKLPEGMDISRIDPSLRLDLLAKAHSAEGAGGARSLFEFSQAPPPPPDKVKPIVPEAPKVVTEAPKPAEPPEPPKPPPPPPISLKFYGYAGTAQSGQKRAFFLDGDEIFVAGENELVRGRYKIIRIGVNSAVVEDTVNKNQQTLPLVEEMA